ncbi:ICEV-like protein [Mya arenaria]|uniref:ICEV-like protein n=1 Tax=Mya arenaria TaxID=6604 RepID=A0ABY7F4X1_MYAAR|nr:serine-rich adhesin for platelets-like [Mya arenaria]XP_052764434.1 serine-rich adhesin for platelets-like [Mya arenaria]WAR15846.1 ICEV-like protein [Mya arenaria]
MATPELKALRDVPGFQAIFKAVLRAQMKHLMEQVAELTNEESVMLTANVKDGTISHVGSELARGFLEDHEDIKSQFLGFCLKSNDYSRFSTSMADESYEHTESELSAIPLPPEQPAKLPHERQARRAPPPQEQPARQLPQLEEQTVRQPPPPPTYQSSSVDASEPPVMKQFRGFKSLKRYTHGANPESADSFPARNSSLPELSAEDTKFVEREETTEKISTDAGKTYTVQDVTNRENENMDEVHDARERENEVATKEEMDSSVGHEITKQDEHHEKDGTNIEKDADTTVVDMQIDAGDDDDVKADDPENLANIQTPPPPPPGTSGQQAKRRSRRGIVRYHPYPDSTQAKDSISPSIQQEKEVISTNVASGKDSIATERQQGSNPGLPPGIPPDSSPTLTQTKDVLPAQPQQLDSAAIVRPLEKDIITPAKASDNISFVKPLNQYDIVEPTRRETKVSEKDEFDMDFEEDSKTSFDELDPGSSPYIRTVTVASRKTLPSKPKRRSWRGIIRNEEAVKPVDKAKEPSDLDKKTGEDVSEKTDLPKTSSATVAVNIDESKKESTDMDTSTFKESIRRFYSEDRNRHLYTERTSVGANQGDTIEYRKEMSDNEPAVSNVSPKEALERETYVEKPDPVEVSLPVNSRSNTESVKKRDRFAFIRREPIRNQPAAIPSTDTDTDTSKRSRLKSPQTSSSERSSDTIPRYITTQSPVTSSNTIPRYSATQYPATSSDTVPSYSNTQSPATSSNTIPRYSVTQYPATSSDTVPSYSNTQYPATSSDKVSMYSTTSTPVTSSDTIPRFSNIKYPVTSSDTFPRYSTTQSPVNNSNTVQRYSTAQTAVISSDTIHRYSTTQSPVTSSYTEQTERGRYESSQRQTDTDLRSKHDQSAIQSSSSDKIKPPYVESPQFSNKDRHSEIVPRYKTLHAEDTDEVKPTYEESPQLSNRDRHSDTITRDKSSHVEDFDKVKQPQVSNRDRQSDNIPRYKTSQGETRRHTYIESNPASPSSSSVSSESSSSSSDSESSEDENEENKPSPKFKPVQTEESKATDEPEVPAERRKEQEKEKHLDANDPGRKLSPVKNVGGQSIIQAVTADPIAATQSKVAFKLGKKPLLQKPLWENS